MVMQQQQPMLVCMPQSMRQVTLMPQQAQPQQQQQVVVVQAPTFSNQSLGVWGGQQVLQQVPEALPVQQVGVAAAAVPSGLPAHSGALAAAMHNAELSSSSYLSPVASGGGRGSSSGGFISRVFAGVGGSSASSAMEQQQLLQDQALLMRNDLCKFDSFTSQGAPAESYAMRPAQQQVLLQQLQQQQQQQQPMGQNIASLESYLGRMSLAGAQQQQQQPGLLVQQEAAMFGSFTSQGGSSGGTEIPGMQQQQYVLQRQDISNLDSFTSQCSVSAGSFSSSGPTYPQTQQQQQQMLFSASYSDPQYYYEPSQAKGVSAVGIAGGSGQAYMPVSLAFEAQGGAAVTGQPLGQLQGSAVQSGIPVHAAAAPPSQTLVVLQPTAGGSAVGSSTGRHSLDMSAAVGTVSVPQQPGAAQAQRQQQQQAGLVQLPHFPQLQ
jgi:hypothetical protein